MARIVFPRVYQIVEFLGRKRGKNRVGSYMPPNWDKYTTGRIHTLQMPTFEFAIGKLVQRGVAPLRAFTVCGIFWALVSEAANKITPGLLVIRDDGALRPMDDDEIAATLGLTRAEWKDALPLLLPGSGVGLLEYTEAAVDIDLLPEEQSAQERIGARDQLPLFFDRRGSGFSTSAATKRMELNEQNETKRNERPPTEPRALRANPWENPKTEAERYVAACLSLLNMGQTRQAEKVFLGALEAELSAGRRDRGMWKTAFLRCTMNLLERSGLPPTQVEIGARLHAVIHKAWELAEAGRAQDGHPAAIRNPAAVLQKWLNEHNLGRPARAAT